MKFKRDEKIFSEKNSRPSRVVRRKSDFSRRRKNFFPTFILALLFWLGWGWLVYSTAPTNNLLLTTFYFLLFLAIFLTAALIFANSRQGFLTALGIICFLIFRYYQIGNILNIALLLGIFLCLEFYLKRQ